MMVRIRPTHKATDWNDDLQKLLHVKVSEAIR